MPVVFVSIFSIGACIPVANLELLYLGVDRYRVDLMCRSPPHAESLCLGSSVTASLTPVPKGKSSELLCATACTSLVAAGSA